MLLPLVFPGLHDGVSQQPASERFPTQSEAKTNCLDTLVSGSGKRPPMEYVATLSASKFGNAFHHTINRDAYEKYNVVVTNGNLQVYDALTGEAKVVAFPDGTGYLNSADPANDFALVSVADYTFVVNKRVEVKMGTEVVPGNIDYTRQQFQDLEDIENVVNGDIVEVAGDERNTFDGYYVVRSGGAWRETARPGILRKFDSSTMPHVLIRQADGTFTFQQQEWDERDAGDDDTNPWPSFVDRTINDVFFYRNRLGFLAADKVIMSRSGGFFNFWRETATDLLDTDPIDTAVTGTKVSFLNYATPFDKTLMLFGDQTQFVLNGGQVLSPKTVSVDPTTTYEAIPQVKPVGLGPSAFFAAQAGSYASIREYFVKEDVVSNSAVEVNNHCPWYIPNDVSDMAGASNDNMLFVRTASKPNEILTYRFEWSNNQKVQSAWNRWEFDADIVSMSVLNNRLFLIYEDDSGTHLGKIDLRGRELSKGLPFAVHLDRRYQLTGTYEAVQDETRFELPFDMPLGVDVEIVLSGDFGSEAGRVITPSELAPNQFAIPGDYSGGEVYIGTTYVQRIVLSRVYFTKGKEPILNGRIQLRNMLIGYRDSGYFTVEVYRNRQLSRAFSVAPAFGVTRNGRIVGSSSWELGVPQVDTGETLVGVRGNTAHTEIHFVNSSPLPSNFSRVEFVAEYQPRTRV